MSSGGLSDAKPRFDVFASALAAFVYAWVLLLPATRIVGTAAGENVTLGDGTDPRGLLWAYEIVWQTWLAHPTRLLFGAVYTTMRDAPGATSLWMPWNERILVVLLHPLLRLTDLPTGVGLAMMTANGAAFAWMARSFRFPFLLQLGGALAFACNPFTRARVAVHLALAGIYYLPLLLGAVERLAARDASLPLWSKASFRTLLGPAFALLLAMTSAHYYLVLVIVTAPWFLGYFALRCWQARPATAPMSPRRYALRHGAAACLASAPALLFLAWNFRFALPPSLAAGVSAYPKVNESTSLYYLRTFGAELVDYVAGDLNFGDADLNPLRALVSRHVIGDLSAASTAHEHANGIRWSVLGLTAMAAFTSLRRAAPPQKQIFALLLLMVIALFSSFAPQLLQVSGVVIGPAMAIHKLIPNFRVPARLGPTVHFAALLIAFIGFSAWLKARSAHWQRWGPAGLLALLVLEFLPLAPCMVSPVRPVRTHLTVASARAPADVKECGAGLFLPFAGGDYWAFEETRGTPCALVNPSAETSVRRLEAAVGNKADAAAAVALAQCMKLDWLVFREEVQPNAAEICAALGFERVTSDACRRATVTPPQERKPLQECSADPLTR
jgi:hypothetical protein